MITRQQLATAVLATNGITPDSKSNDLWSAAGSYLKANFPETIWRPIVMDHDFIWSALIMVRTRQLTA